MSLVHEGWAFDGAGDRVSAYRQRGPYARAWVRKQDALFYGGVDTVWLWWDEGRSKSFESPSRAILAAIERFERRFRPSCSCVQDSVHGGQSALVCRGDGTHVLNQDLFGGLAQMLDFGPGSNNEWAADLNVQDLWGLRRLELEQARLRLGDDALDLLGPARRAAFLSGHAEAADYIRDITLIKLLTYPTYRAVRSRRAPMPNPLEALRSLVCSAGLVPLETYPRDYLEAFHMWVRSEHPLGNYDGPGAYELADALEAYPVKLAIS